MDNDQEWWVKWCRVWAQLALHKFSVHRDNFLAVFGVVQ